MSRHALPLAAALLAVTALPAAADKITLKGGGGYEGRLVRETDKEVTLAVLIAGKTVEMTITRDLIDSYEKAPSALEEYETKAAKVDRKDADALMALVTWCREKSLHPQAAKHCLEALAAKPDHPVAIRMIQSMGYIRSGAGWVNEAEQKRAQGLEKWGEKWLPKEQVTKLRAEQEAKWLVTQAEAKRERDLDTASRGLERVARELKALDEDLKRATGDIETCEAKVKELSKANDEAKKRLADAERRRDDAKNNLRNNNNNFNNNNNNNGDSRLYSEAKKDVRDAEQDLRTLVVEFGRIEAAWKARLQDKTDLEKRIADKEAEQKRLESLKASLGGAPPAAPKAPAKDAPKDIPKDAPKDTPKPVAK
jgi:DNA repair exonuclease SbcCD ATPase subunit